MERLIKPRVSIMFGHLVYLMDGTGTSILFSGLHEEFSNSDSGICIHEKNAYGCCKTFRMHKVWRYLGLRHNIVEQFSSIRNEVAMIQVISVTGKYGMVDLMLSLKEA